MTTRYAALLVPYDPTSGQPLSVGFGGTREAAASCFDQYRDEATMSRYAFHIAVQKVEAKTLYTFPVK